MSVKIGRLSISLSANSGKVKQDFKKANKIVSRFKRRTVKAMKAVGKSVFSFKSAIVGAVGAGGLALMIKSSLDATDAMGKLSAQYRISLKDLAALKLAAEIGGASLDGMLKATKRLSLNINDFANGIGEGKEALDGLGISMDDLAPLNAADRLAFIITKLNGMTDETKRLAFAQDLLGSKNVALLSTFKNGVKELNAYRKEAELLGLVMADDTVKGVEAANDSWTRLSALLGAVKNQTIAALGPAIGGIAEGLKNWIIQANAAEGGIKGLALKSAIAILNFGISAIETFQKMVAGVDRFRDILSKLPGELGEIFKKENTLLELETKLKVAQQQKFTASRLGQQSDLKARAENIENLKLLIEKEKERLAINATGGGTIVDVLKKQSEALEKQLETTIKLKEAGINDDSSKDTKLKKTIPKTVKLEDENSMVLLRDRLEQEAILKAEFLEKELSQKEAFLAREKAIEERLRNEKREAMIKGFSDSASILSKFSQLSQREGKKQSKLSKALNIATIISSTAAGIMRGFADFGPIAGWANAAAVGALGALQLSKVGGGGGGGTPSSPDLTSNPLALGGIAPPGSAVQAGPTINITIDGAVGDANLVEQIADAVKVGLETDILQLNVVGGESVFAT